MSEFDLHLATELRTRVLVLAEAAAACGFAAHLQDLRDLLPASFQGTISDLRALVRTDSELKQRVLLRGDFLAPRDRESLLDSAPDERLASQRRWTTATQALQILAARCPEAVVLAVSGTLAYGAFRHDQDIDIFVIARRGRLWIALLRLLLLSRALRMKSTLSGVHIDLCFSYAMDEEQAERQFASRRDPLFGRDALTAAVFKGEGHYAKLLARATWLRDLYPRLYGLVTARLPASPESSGPAGLATGILNRFLFLVIGAFLRAKAAVRNASFRHRGGYDDLFRCMFAPDLHAFVSLRYERLTAIYATLLKDSAQAHHERVASIGAKHGHRGA